MVDKAPSGMDPLRYSFRTPERMEKLVEENEGQLMVYLKPNFLSIDALVRCSTAIWLIQVTLSQSHSIKVTGLDEVFKGTPTDANKAKSVAITLSEDSFDLANPVTTSKGTGDNEKKK